MDNRGNIHANGLPITNSFFIGGHIVFTVRKDVFDQDEYGYSTKFQRLVNDEKWQEVKKYSTDYVLGHMDYVKECYVLSYKVLKNE